MSDVVITFDSTAGVWRVRRADVTLEIPLEEMVEEYYRWQRDGAPGEWRERAEAFCRKRLDETRVMNTR